MKKLLYTFFFGYLELKWRRLVRTLLLFYMIPISILALYYAVTEKLVREPEVFSFIILGSLYILCPLFSYILKPFVVKED